MNKRSAEDLLEKYRTGRCTAEERAIVENWYASLGEGESPDERTVMDTKRRVWLFLSFQLFPGSRPIWKQVAAAGIVFLFLFGAGYTYYRYFFMGNRLVETRRQAKQEEITPGGQVAVLTLSDGSKISLDAVADGNLAVQGNTDIVKLENGQIAYNENGRPEEVGLNVLQTPRGGQYAVTLSDGTKVWLNAESSITYPTVFNGKERRVNVTGEVYFEVAHRKGQPFFVLSENQELEVLGTHFNVEAYKDEGATKVTLLEGSVAITPLVEAGGASGRRAATVLKPRQQAVIEIGDKPIKVSEVNPDDVVAWKNGLFVFNNEESLENVMRQIARWYDVKVVYKDNRPKEEIFGGSVSRFDQVTTVLKLLEKTGDVHFEVEGKTIFVYAQSKPTGSVRRILN